MTDNVIGRKIRMALEWHGNTDKPDKLFDEVGYDKLMQYVKGEDTPDSTTLIAIAKALDVSVDWLMTDLETTDVLMRDGMRYRKAMRNKVMGWISVGNEIPEYSFPASERVLIFDEDYGICAGWYKGSDGWMDSAGNWLDDVTHWMPLPEPPDNA